MISFANRLREAGLSMNTENTEIMEVGREVGGEELRVLIDGYEIKKVERYKYLGGIFGGDGGNREEITNRIAQYGGVVRAVYPILKDKQMRVEVKKVIFESVLINPDPTLWSGDMKYTVGGDVCTKNDNRKDKKR